MERVINSCGVGWGVLSHSPRLWLGRSTDKGSTDEGGADFSGGGRRSGDFSFRYIFLCLLEMSVEFEVQDLSRLEI